MSRVLAKVRLPLTIDERLEIMAIVADRHDCDVIWHVAGAPHPGARGKWFIVERRRS